MEVARQESCHYCAEILLQGKPSEQVHCHGGETNLHYVISQVMFATHFPIDVIECL